MPGGGESPKGSSTSLSCKEDRSGGEGPLVMIFSPTAMALASFVEFLHVC